MFNEAYLIIIKNSFDFLHKEYQFNYDYEFFEI